MAVPDVSMREPSQFIARWWWTTTTIRLVSTPLTLFSPLLIVFCQFWTDQNFCWAGQSIILVVSAMVALSSPSRAAV